MTIDISPGRGTQPDRRTPREGPADPAAAPKPDVRHGRASRRVCDSPRCSPTIVDGYGDRPALGSRARSVVTDPATGRRPCALLRPEFDTITYRELWSDVTAVATAWSRGRRCARPRGGLRRDHRLRQRRLPDHRPRLRATWAGRRSAAAQRAGVATAADPRRDRRRVVLAVSAAYLDLAVESALGSPSLRRLVVFDYRPRSTTTATGCGAPGHASPPRAWTSWWRRSTPIVRRGGGPCRRAALHRRRPGPAGDDPLHLGQHRRAQGRHVDRADGRHAVDVAAEVAGRAGPQRQLHAAEPPRRPAPAVVGLPGGRHQLLRPRRAICPRCSRTGRWCVPPTSAWYRAWWTCCSSATSRASSGWWPRGSTRRRPTRLAKAELREHVLGGRVLGGFVSTAPLSAEMKVVPRVVPRRRPGRRLRAHRDRRRHDRRSHRAARR